MVSDVCCPLCSFAACYDHNIVCTTNSKDKAFAAGISPCLCSFSCCMLVLALWPRQINQIFDIIEHLSLFFLRLRHCTSSHLLDAGELGSSLACLYHCIESQSRIISARCPRKAEFAVIVVSFGYSRKSQQCL